MLLGSGELGKEVLIALQRLGVETIAVVRYDAPGQPVAHHARTITMSDRTDVALAFDTDVDVVRTNAKLAASRVKPRAA